MGDRRAVLLNGPRDGAREPLATPPGKPVPTELEYPSATKGHVDVYRLCHPHRRLGKFNEYRYAGERADD